MEKFSFFLLLSLLSLSCFGGKIIDGVVASINNEIILSSDLDQFARKLKSKSYQEFFGVNEKVITEPQALIQLLIEEKLIDQQVKRLELSATDQEIDGQVRSILKRNGISQQQLTERLKSLGTNIGDYREGLKRQIERRNLMEREIRPNTEVTEEQLRHFFQRGASSSGGNDIQYRLAHIWVEMKGPDKGKARIQEIHSLLKASPEKFDTLVKESSDDSTSRESGGNIGYFSHSQLSKELKPIIPKIALGGISSPVLMKDGYHIFKVLEQSQNSFDTLSREQKEQIRNQLVSAEVEKQMGLWLERRKTEAHITLYDKKRGNK